MAIKLLTNKKMIVLLLVFLKNIKIGSKKDVIDKKIQ